MMCPEIRAKQSSLPMPSFCAVDTHELNLEKYKGIIKKLLKVNCNCNILKLYLRNLNQYVKTVACWKTACRQTLFLVTLNAGRSRCQPAYATVRAALVSHYSWHIPLSAADLMWQNRWLNLGSQQTSKRSQEKQSKARRHVLLTVHVLHVKLLLQKLMDIRLHCLTNVSHITTCLYYYNTNIKLCITLRHLPEGCALDSSQ